MARKVGELYAVLGLRDEGFRRGLDDGERRFGGFAGTVGTMATRAGLAIGGGVAAGAAIGLKSAVDLDTGMREVFTLLPDLSAGARDKMTADLRAFSKEVGVLPSEAIPALYQALSAGVPPDNVFAFLTTSQQAAVGGVTDLETAVDGISSVVNAYGSDVISATQASDLMFTAVRLGKTNFEELSASLFQVTPTASALGVQFGDVTAALAAMTAQGTPTAVATTQLRQLFVELSKEGSGAAKTFQDLTGKTFAQFVREGGNVEDALKVMADAASDSGGSISDLFGSVEAGNAALALTSESGARAFSNALDEMADSGGATQTAFEEMDAGVGRTLERLKVVGMDFLLSVGTQLQPHLEAFANWMVENMPRIEAVAGQVFGFIGDAIGIVVDAVTFLQETFAALISWWDENAGGFSESTGELTGQLAEWWGQIATIVDDAVALVREVIDQLVQWWQQIWDEHGAHIMEGVMRWMGGVREIIGGVLDAIQAILRTFTALFRGDWDGFWNGIRDTAAAVWRIIQGAWEAFTGQLQVAWELLAGALGAVWDSVWGGIVETASRAWEGIKSVINGLIDGINSILSAWNRLAFEVPRLEIPSFRIPGTNVNIGGGGIGPYRFDLPDLPLIPSLATEGVILQSGIARVHAGEAVVKQERLGTQLVQLYLDTTLIAEQVLERGAAVVQMRMAG